VIGFFADDVDDVVDGDTAEQLAFARDHRGAATGRMRSLPVSKALPRRVIVDRARGDGESKIVGLIIDVLSSLARCRRRQSDFSESMGMSR